MTVAARVRAVDVLLALQKEKKKSKDRIKKQIQYHAV